VFAFDLTCEAANVSVSEEEVANASGPFHKIIMLLTHIPKCL
jgi:hypothetical protein